jgi:hypothetical protein
MFTSKFGEKLAEGLAGQWTSQKIGPSLVFWAGGILAWVSCNGWNALVERLKNVNDAPIVIAWAVGGILLISVFSAILEWFQEPVIRLVEGYWPRPFHRLRFALSERLKNDLIPKEMKWNQLSEKEEKDLTPEEQAERVSLDADLNRYPVDKRLLMPTAFGNLLRAAEEYPRLRYGLDTIVCWPRMWLVMPKETLDVLSEARENLDAGARLMLLGLIFPIWSIWADWAFLSLLLLPVAYWRMLDAAGIYGDLLKAAFDLHRFKLYESLKWPPPLGPEDEDERGTQLTEYLFRGTGADAVRFNNLTRES